MRSVSHLTDCVGPVAFAGFERQVPEASSGFSHGTPPALRPLAVRRSRGHQHSAPSSPGALTPQGSLSPLSGHAGMENPFAVEARAAHVRGNLSPLSGDSLACVELMPSALAG